MCAVGVCVLWVYVCCGCMCAVVGVCVLWVYVCCGCMCAVVGVCVKKQESSVNTNKV
jgi:ribose/xylose/arabinose/galactoside ABC-type transport system permease subunit